MNHTALLQVAGLFLKLGTISFGGPAAHIALMEQEVVVKRGWLEREHFLDLLAATNLVPGPNATEMAIHIGYVHAGWPGLVAGGVAFILPAFCISLALSWLYVRFGSLPAGQAIFYGIHPLVLAIVLVATYRLGKTALSSWGQIVLGLLALSAALLDVNEALILLAAGLAGILRYAPPAWLKKIPWKMAIFPWGILSPASMPAARLAHLLQAHAGFSALSPAVTWLDERLVQLGLFFLKVGSLIFGSGMVLFAFIQKDVVNGFGWLSQQQLVDAIAVGQMTPGPVLSSATFIGYLVSGWSGAVVATAAVFFPSFIIIAVIGPLLPRLRRSPTIQAFLKGVNAGVLALILAVSLALARSAIVDGWTTLLVALGVLALLRFKVDTFWLVLAGAGVGLIKMVLK